MSRHWSFMRDHGVMTNKDYKYKGKNKDCAHKDSKTKGKTKTWGIAGWYNVEKMKAKVMQQPGAVALYASSKQFRFYKSGTLKQCCDASDKNCTEDFLNINHAVTVVGYTEKNEENRLEKCKVKNWWVTCPKDHTDEDGDKNYWKLQNSWGKNWGDKGFIKIKITDGQGVCGINRWGVSWVNFYYDSIPA